MNSFLNAFLGAIFAMLLILCIIMFGYSMGKQCGYEQAIRKGFFKYNEAKYSVYLLEKKEWVKVKENK